MTAAAAAKTQRPLSNKAREMMEAINVEAAEHHVWVRTQANAPAQRPWFSETGGEGSGQLASGRVAVAQMKTLPYMWRWSEFSPYLHRISEIARKAEVSPIEFADRQSILLLNPGLNGRLQVTNTIRCAISIYNPGDVAPVHLHSPNASRTILSDKGGYTVVEGERCTATRGDLILTPNGTWHDHGNDSSEPVIWIDMLDWPLMEFLDAAWVGLRFRYLHPFTNATTPTSYSNFAYVRENVDGFSFVSDQLAGQTLVNHELWAILDAGLLITPKLELAVALIWIDQWHYPPPAASVQTLTGPANVPRNGDQQFTQLLWDTIAVDYALFDEVSLGLGYYNLTNSISADGRLRSPFAAGQDNAFWSPDARIFFDISANLDRIVEDAMGRRKFGESTLGQTASARGPAATVPSLERER